MSSLLDKSLDELKKPQRERPTGPRRSRGKATPSRADASPYARPQQARNTEDSWQHDMFDQDRSRGSSGGGARPSAFSSDTSNKLTIENLHYEVSEAELASLFSQIGPLDKAPAINFDRSGRSTGVAHVTFTDEAHAVEAKSSFDGANAKGQPIKIKYDFSFQKPKNPPELLDRLQGGSQLFEDKPPRSSFQAKAARGRAGYALRGRGGPPGSSGRGRGRAERGSGSDRKKDAPKSAEDLDKELEKFMGADTEMA